jgi:transposase
MQPLPDMYPNRKLTRRCVEFIEAQTGNMTWIDIAEHLGIDEKTVREIGHALVAKVTAEMKPYAPRILGIDELTLNKKLRVMLVDIDRKQVIDILPTFSKAAVIHWLSWLPDRERIKLVAMDMSGLFSSAVQDALPGVPIVADKFHVVRAASGALNSIRIAKGRAAETKAKKKLAYKGRKILLKRPSNLSAKQAFALDGMLANDADLKEAYDAKEKFYHIWDATDRTDAAARINDWLKTCPAQHAEAFKHAVNALTEWREEILTFWGEYPEISNAYTESANGMAKIHNRKGRGYKFHVIRARVLIDMRKITPSDMVDCDGCGIGFAAGMLVGQEAVSLGRGRRKIHLTLCPNCVVDNRVGKLRLRHQPTLQSE